jgi:hypothetical protein
LTDYQVIIETIAATTTKTGLTVEAVVDTGTYPTKVKVSNAQLKAVPLPGNSFTESGTAPYTVDRSRNPYGIRQFARD